MSTQHTQPEALRLADEFRPTMPREIMVLWGKDAVKELRRLHEANHELLAELKKARAYIAEHHASFVETVTNHSTGRIEEAEDLMAVESDQDLLNGIDEAIAKAEGQKGGAQ